MLHYAPIADMGSPNQTSSMRVQSRQCGMQMSHFLLLSSLSTPQGGLALYFGPEARSGWAIALLLLLFSLAESPRYEGLRIGFVAACV